MSRLPVAESQVFKDRVGLSGQHLHHLWQPPDCLRLHMRKKRPKSIISNKFFPARASPPWLDLNARARDLTTCAVNAQVRPPAVRQRGPTQ